jgi:hypothetical protein
LSSNKFMLRSLGNIFSPQPISTKCFLKISSHFYYRQLYTCVKLVSVFADN